MTPIEKLKAGLMWTVDEATGCWNWIGGLSSRGYGSVWVNGKSEKAHREVYRHFVGEIPDGMHILHSCDNTGCVNPSHLSVGTHTDNMRDKIKKGRGNYRVGEACRSSKANAVDVERIRDIARVGGHTMRSVSKYMGIVTESNVSLILRGLSWRQSA